MGVSAIPPERPLIQWHLTETPPPGYIKANAPEVSRAAYAWLFSKIGTKYGAGDGVTTFIAGPDLRGVVPRGLDDGRGVDPGRVLGSEQLDAIKEHGFSLRDLSSGAPVIFDPSAGVAISDVGAAVSVTSGASVAGSRVTIGAGNSETRMRNVAGLYCIAIAP